MLLRKPQPAAPCPTKKTHQKAFRFGCANRRSIAAGEWERETAAGPLFHYTHTPHPLSVVHSRQGRNFPPSPLSPPLAAKRSDPLSLSLFLTPFSVLIGSELIGRLDLMGKSYQLLLQTEREFGVSWCYERRPYSGNEKEGECGEGRSV